MSEQRAVPDRGRLARALAARPQAARLAAFDNLGGDAADDWLAETSLRMIGTGRVGACVEVHCGQGVRQLSTRADRLVSFDATGRGALSMLGEQSGCRLRWMQGAVPDDLPTEPAELILLVGIGRYLRAQELARTLSWALDRLTADGRLVLATAHGPARATRLGAAGVHAAARRRLGPARECRRSALGRVELWRPRPSGGPARPAG